MPPKFGIEGHGPYLNLRAALGGVAAWKTSSYPSVLSNQMSPVLGIDISCDSFLGVNTIRDGIRQVCFLRTKV